MVTLLNKFSFLITDEKSLDEYIKLLESGKFKPRLVLITNTDNFINKHYFIIARLLSMCNHTNTSYILCYELNTSINKAIKDRITNITEIFIKDL